MTEYLFMTILLVIVVMETVTTESEVIKNYSSCSSLMCENDSLCKTTIYLSSGQERAQAQCVCHGSYTGPRCEAVMKLIASDIKSRSIRISIQFNRTESVKMPSEKVLEKHLLYSLNYWDNKTAQKECSVIPKSSVRSHVISGLQPETDYTFCANSDSFINWCPKEDISNCVAIKTPNDLTSDSLPPYLLPVAIVVVVLIIVTLVSALIIRTKKFKCTQSNEGNYLESQTFEFKKRRKKKDKSNQDLFLLPGTPPSERLQINTPPSPGRPKHSLTKHSSRGYASFSAKNDTAIALKTVLEYIPNENNDITEPCLIVHDKSTV